MSPKRKFWSRYALIASLAIPLLAVVCLGSTSVTAWTWMAMLSFGALAVLLVGATFHRVKLPWHPLLWPVAAFGVLVLAQYFLRFTVYPAATLDGILQLAACACELYLALFALRDSHNRKRAGTVLWIFAGVLGAEALAQFFTDHGFIYWYRDARYGTPVGPFIYHNHFAGCVDLLLPIAIAVAMRVRRKSRDQPWLARARRGILPALALAAVIVSQSRGGLFALIFEAGLAVALFWPRLRRDARVRRRALIGAAALIAFTLLAGWQPLISRLTKLEYHDVSAVYRARVGLACLAIWRDSPWIGAGFGTFPQVYPRYQSFDSGQQWNEAHDDYAQSLAETGLAGAAAVFAFIVILGVLGWRVHRQLQGSAAAVQIAALIGCAGLLFHSFGDFQFHAPANALLFFLFIGLAAAVAGTRREVGMPTLDARRAADGEPAVPTRTRHERPAPIASGSPVPLPASRSGPPQRAPGRRTR